MEEGNYTGWVQPDNLKSELTRRNLNVCMNYYEGGIYEKTSEARGGLSGIVVYNSLIFAVQSKFLWSV